MYICKVMYIDMQSYVYYIYKVMDSVMAYVII